MGKISNNAEFARKNSIDYFIQNRVLDHCFNKISNNSSKGLFESLIRVNSKEDYEILLKYNLDQKEVMEREINVFNELGYETRYEEDNVSGNTRGYLRVMWSKPNKVYPTDEKDIITERIIKENESLLAENVKEKTDYCIQTIVRNIKTHIDVEITKGHFSVDLTKINGVLNKGSINKAIEDEFVKLGYKFEHNATNVRIYW